MRELLRRSITGAIYIVLLLGAVFLSPEAFDFLFMIFGLACLYEFKQIVKLKGYAIFISYLALWWTFIYLVQNKSTITLLMALTLMVDIALLLFLYAKKPQRFTTFQKFVAGLLYLGSGCIFLTMIPYRESHFAQHLIVGIFILIWINDSFAYLVGRTLGRTPLYPAVSPQKTVEGALGGLVFVWITAYLLAQYETTLTPWQWILLATVISITGNLGDLLQSKFKRAAGVKDSGAVLPGHGGIWDRLDSMVFAAPFAYITLNLFNHVS